MSPLMSCSYEVRVPIEHERATIFVGGPRCSFISVPRAKYLSKRLIQSQEIGLFGPDVVRALRCPLLH